jgi:hypothetical protein
VLVGTIFKKTLQNVTPLKMQTNTYLDVTLDQSIKKKFAIISTNS